MRMRDKPRFTIKDLLVGTTLVSAGLMAAVYSWCAEPALLQTWQRPLFPWPIGCAMVGAGAMYPFKKATLGILIGLGVSLFVL
jgi:hypothetical protein